MSTDQADFRGSTPATRILNVAAYKFARLTNLVERRDGLRQLTSALSLRGTILLSEEGINLFVAGSPECVGRVLDVIQTDSEIGQLDVKQSTSDYQPFSRMLVKIKQEIIAFGVPGVDPLEKSHREDFAE